VATGRMIDVRGGVNVSREDHRSDAMRNIAFVDRCGRRTTLDESCLHDERE
jgi:hypothetical protein